MADYVLNRVGANPSASGSATPGRSDTTGATVTTDAHGHYAEANRLQSVFALRSGTVTLAAGNVTAAVLGTLKWANGFWNPPNSGKNAVILQCAAATVSGTPGGHLLYSYLSNIVISSAATGVIHCANLTTTGQTGTSMIPLVNVILATLPANTTTADTVLGVMGGAAAIAAGAGLYTQVDDVQGRILVPPGCSFGLTAYAVGTSHVIDSSIWWEEIPILT